MANKFQIDGAVQAMPVNPASTDGLSTTIGLKDCRNYAHQASGNHPVSGVVTLNPSGITAIKFVVIRSLNGDALVALVSSSLGADQEIPFDDILMFRTGAAVPVTEIKVSGTGEIEYLLGGD